jgi:hypothetical protein
MRLPYPFENLGRLALSVELKSPTGGVLADARKCAENGDVYQALLAYVAGSVASITFNDGSSVEHKEQVKNSMRDMPWPLTEWLAFRSMIASGVSDEIDVQFECPRCGHKFYRDEEPVTISGMKIADAEDVPVVAYSLVTPVVFKDARSGDPLESISALTFRLPTIADCIKAAGRIGTQDDTRLQYAIWAEAITARDGVEVDQKFRGTWGNQIFERMDLIDLRAMAKALAAWAIDNTIPTFCGKCGKAFVQEVPTGTFFASGLRGQ